MHTSMCALICCRVRLYSSFSGVCRAPTTQLIAKCSRLQDNTCVGVLEKSPAIQRHALPTRFAFKRSRFCSLSQPCDIRPHKKIASHGGARILMARKTLCRAKKSFWTLYPMITPILLPIISKQGRPLPLLPCSWHAAFARSHKKAKQDLFATHLWWCNDIISANVRPQQLQK